MAKTLIIEDLNYSEMAITTVAKAKDKECVMEVIKDYSNRRCLTVCIVRSYPGPNGRMRAM